jgi:hypothetical protein
LSKHGLLGITILPLHGGLSPSPPTSIVGVIPPQSSENGSLENVYFIHA